MELVIQILMLFIVVNTILKLSFWKWWQTMLFGLLCAVFIVVACQYAVLQSKTQLADYLANKAILQDTAVLITMESVLCVAFCFATLSAIHRGKRKLGLKILDWYPGLLLFPVLFYLLTQTIYAMPGSDFSTIAQLLAAGIFIAIPLLSFLIKYLYPEKELRLEVHFLVSLFVCIIGLITTVNGNVTYAVAKEPLNVQAIILSIGLFLILFLSGILLNKIKWNIKWRVEN
jgi:hypothetical protein